MDNLLALVRPLLEVFHIFRRVDGGCLGQDFLLPVYLLDLVRHKIDAVRICFSVQDHMERIILHIISGPQLVAQVAGAVGAQDYRIAQNRFLPSAILAAVFRRKHAFIRIPQNPKRLQYHYRCK